jgi:uncharacterized protein (DUF1330 family)
MTKHMPNAETLEQLRGSPEGPIVMLNLIKYAGAEGREAFKRYGAITAGLIDVSQGKLIFAGKAGPVLTGSDTDWDDVIIVRFPSAAHFLRMVESDTYTQEAAPIRAEALEATIWMAAHPFPGFAE